MILMHEHKKKSKKHSKVDVHTKPHNHDDGLATFSCIENILQFFVVCVPWHQQCFCIFHERKKTVEKYRE